MTSRRIILAVAALTGIHATTALAQAAPPSGASASAVVRYDLRSLSSAQEVFFAGQGRYTRALDSLSWRPTPGTTITIEDASTTGWRASARREGLQGECTVHIGTGRRPGTFTPEGEPTCGAPRSLLPFDTTDIAAAMGPVFSTMMGGMYSNMYDQLTTTLAKPETAERMATFARNYLDALIRRGFSRAEALQLVAAATLPNVR